MVNEKQMNQLKSRGLCLVGILAIVFAIHTLLATPVFAEQDPSAKHIILFIGDGMQLEHERATSFYLHGVDNGLSFHDFPYQTSVATWDVNTYNRYAWWMNQPPYDPARFNPFVGYNPAQGGTQPYPLDTDASDAYFLTPLYRHGSLSGPSYAATDSASSATAMATGKKTEAGRLAWALGGEEGGELDTIAEIMRRQLGAAIGVVSTVPFNHATPAAFVSHNVSRGNTYTGRGGYEGQGIADEIILDLQPDVVIGAGHPKWDNPDFDTNRGFISEKLYNHLRESQDFVFVERQEGQDGGKALKTAATQAINEGRRLFGLFGGPGSNFEPPIPHHKPGEPYIERATEENPTLSDLSVEAIRVLSQNPNGFFLMIEQGDLDWANHSNDYGWMIGTTWDLDEAVKDVLEFIEEDETLDWTNTLLIVTSDHGNNYLRLIDEDRLGAGVLPRQEQASEEERAAGAGPYVYPDGEVTMASTSHTNELVTLYAKGEAAVIFESFEGKWYPGTRIIDNTHIFDVMALAAGVNSHGAVPVPLMQK